MKAPTTLTIGVVAVMSASACAVDPAAAQDVIKLGLSVPLSGSAANWGKGSEFMCQKAAEEINQAGGIKASGKTYNFECITYDNKYNAAEGTKVAQTLINRDAVKFIGGALGTAPTKALQAIAERQDVLLFTVSWGKSLKGPEHPMTFTQQNTPYEILPPLIGYVVKQHSQAKTVAMLNPNDATGQETEPVAKATYEKNGIKVFASDYYERGTTEFQAIAARIASFKPEIIDVGSTPPADAGAIFKALDLMGWKGVKVNETGTGADTLKETGGDAAEGVYMGSGVVFDGDTVSAYQRKLNDEARKLLGEDLNTIQIGFYDAVYALKTAMETANSVEAKKVAETLPDITFPTFYGGKVGFFGKETYGNVQQMRLPILVTQVQKGKLVQVHRIDP